MASTVPDALYSHVSQEKDRRPFQDRLDILDRKYNNVNTLLTLTRIQQHCRLAAFMGKQLKYTCDPNLTDSNASLSARSSLLRFDRARNIVCKNKLHNKHFFSVLLMYNTALKWVSCMLPTGFQ